MVKLTHADGVNGDYERSLDEFSEKMCGTRVRERSPCKRKLCHLSVTCVIFNFLYDLNKGQRSITTLNYGTL